MRRRLYTPARQRGAGSLAVVLLLVLIVGLLSADGRREAWQLARSTTSAERSSQAFEAAEAGLQWAMAMLNESRPLSDACEVDATGTPLRERLLARDPSSGQWRPTTWTDAGGTHRHTVACLHGPAGWACHCPPGSVPGFPSASVESSDTVFRIEVLGHARPGVIQVVSRGCADEPRHCLASNPIGAEAVVQSVLVLVPAVPSAPLAAVVARGDVVAPSGDLAVENTDWRSQGVVILAGGRVDLPPGARIEAAPGAVRSSSVIEGDSEVAGLAPEAFFARHFGMSPSGWREQPTVRRLTCNGPCEAALEQAVAGGHAQIVIEGDATLRGPLRLGSPERPLALVVTGSATLRGEVQITGVLHVGQLQWAGSPGTRGRIQGALLVAGSYSGDAALDITRDAAVLEALRSRVGSFSPLPGSWKDF